MKFSNILKSLKMFLFYETSAIQFFKLTVLSSSQSISVVSSSESWKNKKINNIFIDRQKKQIVFN